LLSSPSGLATLRDKASIKHGKLIMDTIGMVKLILIGTWSTQTMPKKSRDITEIKDRLMKWV
jgi:hypothetical protein